jgi:hypothetical protein
LAEAANGTAVVIGITGTCPYGIGACWGGAYEVLHRLEDVSLVNPLPNADESTADVFLEDKRLPKLDRWNEQFHRIVNGNYRLRGVEIKLRGGIEKRDGQLFLLRSEHRPEVQLVPLTTDKIQWDRTARAPEAPKENEVRAYDELATRNLVDGQHVTITGPLTHTDVGYQVHVRVFDV